MNLSNLIPALAVTVVPVLLLVPVVWALRPQGGRHRPGFVLKVVASWNPYDVRVRDAIAHYADKRRKPFEPAYATADRDMTGAFPVVRAAA